MRVVLALGVAMALVVSGAGAAALTVNEARWEGQRILAEAVQTATTGIADARAVAVAARMELVTSVAMARPLAAGARELLDLAPGWATAADLASLRSAVEALEAALDGAKAAPIDDVDAAMLDEVETWVESFSALARDAWSSADGVDARARALRQNLDDLARSAVLTGTTISTMALAAESVKDEARTELARVADAARSQLDTLESLKSYSAAWTAAQNAHATAEAAAAEAAAAAAAASESGGTLMYWDVPPDFVIVPLTNLYVPYLANPWDDPCDYC